MVRLICSLLASLPAAIPAYSGAPQALLVDCSGSMRPYYQEGLIADLSATLLEALRAEGEVSAFAFSTTVSPLPQVAQLANLAFGKSTYLDRAIDKAMALHSPIAWMITDNIQDQPGAKEVGNTEVFYQRLRSQAVKKVTIFPLRQPPGRAGIVIYALLLDEAAQEQYEKGLAGFKRRAGQILHTDPLRMKPLDKDTVQINFVRANVSPKGSIVLYQAGKPVRERLEIRFKSRFDHLEISDAQIRVVEGKARFDSESLLVPERRVITITPQRVWKLTAGDETDQVYVVDIDLGRLHLKHDLASIWRAAWGKSGEEAELKLAFVIEVPQQNFRLSKQFLQTYYAPSPVDASATGRIYALDQLPKLMSERLTEVRVESLLRFRVGYPWWPSLVWILLLLAGAGLVVLLILILRKVSFARTKEWDVAAESDRGATLECQVDRGNVSVQRDVVGVIERNKFVPIKGVVLEGGAVEAPISAGLRLKIEAFRRPMVLVFREKRAAPQAAPADIPRRR